MGTQLIAHIETWIYKNGETRIELWLFTRVNGAVKYHIQHDRDHAGKHYSPDYRDGLDQFEAMRTRESQRLHDLLSAFGDVEYKETVIRHDLRMPAGEQTTEFTR